jgi:hypothetical protein
MAEMKIHITANDTASSVIDSVKNKIDGMDAGVKSATANIATNFANLHFAIVDAMELAGKALEAVERYAGYAEVKEQLNLMAGQYNTTADAIVASMKKVSEGQFSIEQATKSAASALKNSLTPEQIIGLTEAAKAFNDVAGVSVPEAFDRLADAVQKGSAKAAVSIVGKEGLGDAMKALAKGADDAGKSGALYEAIMAKTATQMKATGGATQTLGDNIDKLKASWSDLTLKFSGVAVAAMYGIASIFTATAAAATRLASGITAAYSALQVLKLDFSGAKETLQSSKDMWGSADELSKKADEYMKLAGEVTKTATATKALAESESKLSSTSESSSTTTTTSGTSGTTKTSPITKVIKTADALKDIQELVDKNKELTDDLAVTSKVLVDTTNASKALDSLVEKINGVFALFANGTTFEIKAILTASPPKPFSEGIAAMAEKLRSLPTTGTYNIKASAGSGGSSSSGRGNQNITFNVTAAGTSTKELDKELAALVSRKSSKLRLALEAA